MRRILFGMVLCLMFARPGMASPIQMSQTGPGTLVREPASMVFVWTALALTVVFRRRAIRLAATAELVSQTVTRRGMH